MRQETFRLHFDRLLKWFNKSDKNVSLDLWFDRVKSIPDEAFPAIVDTLCDTSKFFPTPQDVRNMFEEWRSSNPEKQAVRHRTWCEDCGGTGAIRIRKKEGSFTRETFYRCRACKNWEGSIGLWVPAKYLSEVSEEIVMHSEKEMDDLVPAPCLTKNSPRGKESLKNILVKITDESDIPF